MSALQDLVVTGHGKIHGDDGLVVDGNATAVQGFHEDALGRDDAGPALGYGQDGTGADDFQRLQGQQFRIARADADAVQCSFHIMLSLE